MHILKYRSQAKLSVILLLCGILLAGCVGGRFSPDGWAAPAVSGDTLYVISQKNGEFLAVDLSNPHMPPANLTPTIEEESANFLGCEGPDSELVGYAAPIIVNGVAYLADYEGTLYAVDTETGTESWREPVETDGQIVAAPALYDADGNGIADTLIVASDDQLSAVSLEDASPLWEDPFEADGKIWSDVVVDGAHAYFGTLHHKLYAVELASGKGRVLRDFDGPVVSTPLIVDGVIYVGTFESEFYAMDAETGDLTWDEPFKADDWFWSRAAYRNGTVYVGSRDGHVYAIDAETGQQEWESPLNGPVRSAVVIGGDTLLAATKTDEGAVYALDLESGQDLWRPIRVGKVYADPWVEDTTAYYLNEDDELYALDVAEGRILWDVPLDRD